MTNLLLQGKPFSDDQTAKLIELGYNIKHFTNNEFDNLQWPNVIAGSIDIDLKKPQQYPNLKLIQLYSAGFDSVGIEDAKAHGIKVCNARGAYSVQIAEYVVWKLLDVYKNVRVYEKSQQETNWNRDEHMVSLVNQKVAILGTGSIGQEVAKRLVPFQVELIGFNTSGRLDTPFHKAYPLNTLTEQINDYDVVIVCLPLNNDTQHLFNKEMLLKMKETATLINIGRGPIVSEEALVSVLDNHLRGVVLDVFETEPLPKSSLLWKHPKAYITSHVSYIDDRTRLTRGKVLFDNLCRYIQNQPLENVIV